MAALTVALLASVTVRSQAYGDFLDDTAVVGPTAGGGAIVQFTMNARTLPENTVVQYTISNGDPDTAIYVSVNCTTGAHFLQRLLGYDGRLYAGEDLPVVIYPNLDRNGNPFLEFYTFYQPDRSRLTLRVTAQTIANLPANPTSPVLVGTTRDGLATLYYLPSREFQVNYAPNDEGKVFVVIFDRISPTRIRRADYPQ